MRYVLMVMTAILALSGLVIGGVHMLGGFVGYADFVGNGDLGDIVDTKGYLYHDNASRFLGGIFLTLGLGFLYCLYELDSKTQLFHFLLLCIFVGGLARIIGWFDLGLIPSTVPATAIELVFPPVMLLIERGLHSAND
jgi:hypothetical protein